MNLNQKDCFAYRIYPEPNGTNYYQSDLITREQVERLFDYCQILEAIIFEKGWIFLVNNYGFEDLFSINNKSEWFECNDVEEFKEYIDSYRNDTKNLE
ncbi:hypothetical protein [Paenibacillus taichungensis]|uniref:hypothetical protein n=1 Tax=Paenibacillus taichungensis TaxID=484184 RepID=UPI0038D097F1